MRFVVATHGHCFDGLASAVLFTRLVQKIAPEAELEYRACGYGANQAHADAQLLSGDENAILDYRFTPAPQLSWYFDHHRTAFATHEDRLAFEAAKPSRNYFFDPNCSSCTKLIAQVSEERYALTHPDLAELIEWADIIDSARFQSPQDAIDRNNPIMRFASVIEHHGDDAFLAEYVPRLLSKPLSAVATSDAVEKRYQPLHGRYLRFVERVKARSERRGRVVFVDLTDSVVESIGKFVTYALYPDSVYSVVVGRLASGVKISVGYNPWCGQPLDRDISALCARWGGGGHSVVGGISFRKAELERARQVAEQISAELSATD